MKSEAELVERRARSERSHGLGTNYIYAGDRYKDDLEPEMPVCPGSVGTLCLYISIVQDITEVFDVQAK